jgi:hypothetical protein
MARPSNPFFNAHHSPMGAFATLTFGAKGSRGGMGLEMAKPADQPVYIGVEDSLRPGEYAAFPFFEGGSDEAARYDVENESAESSFPAAPLRTFADGDVAREFGPATDEWSAPDLTVKVITPNWSIPDPSRGSDEAFRRAIRPAMLIEIEVDNTQGAAPRRCFIGTSGSSLNANLRPLETPGLTGFAQGREWGLACAEGEMKTAFHFSAGQALAIDLESNRRFFIAPTALLIGEAAPGERKTFVVAAGFYREGTATTGIECRYVSSSLWPDLEAVLTDALSDAASIRAAAQAEDEELRASGLSEARQLLTAAARRSYAGSTELLMDKEGESVWVVNEGEYRMMNTFDLAIDHLFYEMDKSPWAVKNILQLFKDRYSYRDEVRLPSGETGPGGVSFTHDMGVGNQFSRPGWSSYELAGLTGCFSYMTAEQLLNFMICSSLYALRCPEDKEFIEQWQGVMAECVESLENRDHPDAGQRTGLIGGDSSRCEGGSEITTYDSIDPSLGQARNNAYIGVKAAAAALLTQRAFLPDDARLPAFAERTAKTLLANFDAQGTLPAVLFEGVEARIIPAIEGLAYLAYAEIEMTGAVAELAQALRGHLEAVLASGVCRFPDGGWKLSSSSANSWLSKIFLCQWTAETLWGIQTLPEDDEAHWRWISEGPVNGYWCFSDQIVNGQAEGSKYYPRGVTNWLWTAKS